jgi:hypothetical protein
MNSRLTYHHRNASDVRPLAGSGPVSELIRVKPTQDGTYTVYRGSLALVSGLTRLQAERYEASIAYRQRVASPLVGA